MSIGIDCKSGLNHYTAYGVALDSEVDLPELRTRPYVEGSEPDLSIRLCAVPPLPNEDGHAFIHSEMDGELRFFSRAEGRFVYRAGREILLDPVPEMAPSALRLYILGAGLNIALFQRGLWVFHASVVCIEGKAVAFLGHPHAGKTTMAATLHRRGHTLLSDDVLAIRMTEDGPLALPGFPRFKLWPDSAEALGVEAETLPRIKEDMDKRSCAVARRFREEPAPLVRMYTLGEGPAPEIALLNPRQAHLELIPYWDLSKFGAAFLQGRRLGTCFLQCGELARRVPVSMLTRTTDLADLPRLADLVENDAVAAPSRRETGGTV
ncbi:MAG TPA: hypothetical protein PKM22_16130 [Candidatus Hydrogenedentes bacterium]|nr:hypothetical protein [Candidatus Hydrogenedentota bacterium]HPV38705.1 hypothetical protein [Candidatus Hydrogenedentota bacterium]